MAVGDDARYMKYPTVPDLGEEGRVRWGAREINRTRDFVAQIKALIPKSRQGYREAAGMGSGTQLPNNANGQDGDIYFRIVS